MHNKDNFYIQCAYRLICICLIVFILIAKLNKGGCKRTHSCHFDSLPLATPLRFFIQHLWMMGNFICDNFKYIIVMEVFPSLL